LIAFFSLVIDSTGSMVSSIASRLPSLLSSLGILLALLRFGGRNEALAFLCAGFPVLTGLAVIFDPLQSLLLLPALIIPLRLFEKSESPTASAWLLTGVSLTAASAVKGLNGLVIPSFAIGVHLLLQLKRFGMPRVLREGVRFLLFALVPALLLTAAIYFLYHLKIGQDFTEEFLWVQHFGRSRSAMEAHGGGPLYHFFWLVFGGIFLTPLLGLEILRKRPDYVKWGYPLTFALSFVLVFSLSATKLPHYTWPAWVGLAWFTGRLYGMSPPNGKTGEPDRRLSFLLSSPVFFLGTLALLLALAPGLLLESLPPSPEIRGMLAPELPLPLSERAALLLTALSCFVFQTFRSRVTRSAARTAAFALIAYLGLALSLTPLAARILVNPFQEIASELRARGTPASSCIRYSGPLSATLSIALAPGLRQNQCPDGVTNYRITPHWREAECSREGLKPLTRTGPLLLCGKL
jgi:hypothetical protein